VAVSGPYSTVSIALQGIGMHKSHHRWPAVLEEALYVKYCLQVKYYYGG
jgi:hypothetical protein